MLDTIYDALLKHRRVLMLSLDNKNDIVIQAIKEELIRTNVIELIEEVTKELRNRINGKTN